MFWFPNQQSPCLVTDRGQEEELDKKLGVEGRKFTVYACFSLWFLYDFIYLAILYWVFLLLHMRFL